MQSQPQTFPPRLHAILAHNGKIGIVLRRGPSRQVATFLWDLRKDTFTLGQWLKGRIYERRSDLSPDGKYMIYFAMNGRWQSETRGSWTAVSKTPWLKALDLYAKGDCWEGGGLFLSKDTYWLNDKLRGRMSPLRKTSPLQVVEEFTPEPRFGLECTGVYYPRLMRDGWQLISYRDPHRTVFEKPLLKGWILRKIAHEGGSDQIGKGCYWDEHELENTQSGGRIRCPDWEWAEWDRQKLVWAQSGKLYRAAVASTTKLKPARLLHDFTDYGFEPIEAPY